MLDAVTSTLAFKATSLALVCFQGILEFNLAVCALELYIYTYGFCWIILLVFFQVFILFLCLLLYILYFFLKLFVLFVLFFA